LCDAADVVAGAVSSLQSCFNAAVAALRSTQLQLAVDLKAAEGRMLMMLKELALLKVGLGTVCYGALEAQGVGYEGGGVKKGVGIEFPVFSSWCCSLHWPESI
jgi:hypothetical protein